MLRYSHEKKIAHSRICSLISIDTLENCLALFRQLKAANAFGRDVIFKILKGFKEKNLCNALNIIKIIKSTQDTVNKKINTDNNKSISQETNIKFSFFLCLQIIRMPHLLNLLLDCKDFTIPELIYNYSPNSICSVQPESSITKTINKINLKEKFLKHQKLFQQLGFLPTIEEYNQRIDKQDKLYYQTLSDFFLLKDFDITHLLGSTGLTELLQKHHLDFIEKYEDQLSKAIDFSKPISDKIPYIIFSCKLGQWFEAVIIYDKPVFILPMAIMPDSFDEIFYVPLTPKIILKFNPKNTDNQNVRIITSPVDNIGKEIIRQTINGQKQDEDKKYLNTNYIKNYLKPELIKITQQYIEENAITNQSEDTIINNVIEKFRSVQHDKINWDEVNNETIQMINSEFIKRTLALKNYKNKEGEYLYEKLSICVPCERQYFDSFKTSYLPNVIDFKNQLLL